MASCPIVPVEEGASRTLDSAVRFVIPMFDRCLCNLWVLMGCKAIIALVSAFDTYLTLKYVMSLHTYEQNPIGRWLMGLDSGPVSNTQQIAAFITAKFLGTVVVMMAIQGLAYYRLRWAGMIAIPIAAFQLYLVLHLLFGPG